MYSWHGKCLLISVTKIKIIATTIKIIEIDMDLDGGRTLSLNFHLLLIALEPGHMLNVTSDCSGRLVLTLPGY